MEEEQYNSNHISDGINSQADIMALEIYEPKQSDTPPLSQPKNRTFKGYSLFNEEQVEYEEIEVLNIDDSKQILSKIGHGANKFYKQLRNNELPTVKPQELFDLREKYVSGHLRIEKLKFGEVPIIFMTLQELHDYGIITEVEKMIILYKTFHHNTDDKEEVMIIDKNQNIHMLSAAELKRVWMTTYEFTNKKLYHYFNGYNNQYFIDEGEYLRTKDFYENYVPDEPVVMDYTIKKNKNT